MRFSLVVPAYNEARYLPRLLDSVDAAGRACRRGPSEDVDFLLRLRRLGLARAQRLARMGGAKAIASVRKFDEHGDWHYLTMMPRVALGWLLRRDTGRELADRYWYRPNR